VDIFGLKEVLGILRDHGKGFKYDFSLFHLADNDIITKQS